VVLVIWTPDQRLRVFVSSVLGELADERRAVGAAVSRLGLTPVRFESGARPYPPREVYRAYLAQCDVFVGVYWQRYGWVAPGMDVSGLEDEFSLSGGLPRLLYVKEPAPHRDPQMAALLARVEVAGAECYRAFGTPRELGRLVREDLALLLSERFAASGPGAGVMTSGLLAPGAPGSAMAVPGGGLAAATRTLPRDTASFTGRGGELRRLVAAVEGARAADAAVGVYVVGGMAGVGKTAFVVHAAHALAPLFPGGQIFLPLHAHTPGQEPVDPADALASLLLTAGVAAEQIPPGAEPRARLWRDRLAGRRVLLVLDDAAGHEQVRPLLPGTAGGAVLVTCRGHLTGLEDATAISLGVLPAEEAAHLLARLSRRADVSPGDAAATRITGLCGFLPLAIRMIASQLHHHPSWTTADLAADLASTRDRLGLMAAGTLSVASAFDMSYRDLASDQQQLFRRLGLHPGTDIDPYTAAALHGTDVAAARSRLRSLYDHCLLTETARDRYQMHDLIREHARTLAVADPAAGRDAAISRLSDFYLHTVRIASQHLARRPMPAHAAIPDEHLPALLTRQDATAWLDAEYLNLHAAALYAALHDRPRHAVAIAVAMHGFLRSQGHWHQAVTLHLSAVGAARAAGDKLAEAEALTHLGDVQRLTDDYQAAAVSLTQAAALCLELKDQAGEAAALSELGAVQFFAADYHAAAASYQRALELSRSTGDRLGQASALNELGCVEYKTGKPQAAAATLELALDLFREIADQHGEAHALNHLSAVQEATGDHGLAAASLARALDIYRQLGDRLGQAEALHRLGAVQHATGDHDSASQSLTRALNVYRHLGSKLGEAEVLNSIGDLSLATGSPLAPTQALYEHALALAAAILSPFEQARALEGIGRCQLRGGHPRAAAKSLNQARAVYQRIGSPDASQPGLAESHP
jgi:tetratricopeptide (TPR) repeat protein